MTILTVALPSITSLHDAVAFGLRAFEPVDFRNFLKDYMEGKDITTWLADWLEDSACVHYEFAVCVGPRTDGDSLDDDQFREPRLP